MNKETSAISLDPNKNCAICNVSLGLLLKRKIGNGYICRECFNKAGYDFLTSPVGITTKLSKEEIKSKIAKHNESQELVSNFNATKKITSYLEVDENKKQWLIPQNVLQKNSNSGVYNFSDILEFELLEDNNSIAKSGVGRALIGGALLGGVGAIVGATTAGKEKVISNLQIKITIDNLQHPIEYITLINKGTKSKSTAYKNKLKQSQEILSVFEIMIRDSKK